MIISLTGCRSAVIPTFASAKNAKIQNILYFNPEIFPDILEIREPTYTAFYAAVSEKENHIRNLKMLRVDSPMPFDSVQASVIKEFCINNNAELAVVPKVKYFKVGFGKYIFSNQVIISMKLYDASGNLLTETSYDTYKKNARLLGSAENSIKIGTAGAIQNMTKYLARTRTKTGAPTADANLF
ncbi:pyruvate decarboxylase [Kaistella palustris]|uniref:pyruvate decarboxylase n=1 Tax=Kaistella palustris TaxID=493376 RepID=UPI001F34812A|nr:pyruvate decarboxylase [Kaistella palustris]